MSFRKRNADQQPKLPPGSRLSAYNGQLLISTGVPSLDDIIGGGLPVGTVLLIKEDRATTYAQLLLKYFLAQGMASGHHCALASRDEEADELLRNLMWLATSGANDDDDDHDAAAKSAARSNAEGDRLKIAWRYAHLKKFETGVRQASPSPQPQTQSSTSGGDGKSSASNGEPKPYCSLFDLTKKIPESVLEETKPTVLDNADGEDDYATLLENIRKLILENNFSSAIPAKPNTMRNVLRIGIHSLASPSWQNKSSCDLYKFFHALRGLLRFSFGAAVVTIPAYLYDEAPNFVKRIEHMVDAVVEVESFAGSMVHNDAPYTQNYHGFFYVHKLPVLNSLLPPSTKLSVLSAGGSNDLAFKLRRKRFAIETFHLPPEGGVSERRTEPPPSSETKKKQPKKIGCGSTPGKTDPLEF
ncbi:Elongator complex protein 4 [Zychaea mexicana]|uniref:Elongator complex protein 4 n=1 Tax=Zychaea mexicana TaxID=64656 RepID=UPI0022FF1924|nr:Elongator complex protein 4 [Zychaea mexicana]KAI9484374.1 Elongator complex protein 4 [Zychaea mexicana]